MSTLFDGFNLQGLQLRNRIVMAPMTRSRAPSTVPDALTATYYGQRASAGLVITEGAQVSEQGRGYLFTPGMHSNAQVQGWKAVTAAVHARGGAIFAQLWHVGRVAHCSVQPYERAPVGPVAVAAKDVNAFGYREDGTPGQMPVSKPRALATDEIPGITADFVAAARNAIEAGFDGIEIHGANGYLFEQFINGGLNTRDDRYGGAEIDNRLTAAGDHRRGLRGHRRQPDRGTGLPVQPHLRHARLRGRSRDLDDAGARTRQARAGLCAPGQPRQRAGQCRSRFPA